MWITPGWSRLVGMGEADGCAFGAGQSRRLSIGVAGVYLTNRRHSRKLCLVSAGLEVTMLISLLKEWSELEPTVCKSTFMPGTFEIFSPLDFRFLDAKYSLNFGRKTNPEREYLLNAVLECQCFIKNWFVVQSFPKNQRWTCAIECRKTRKRANFSAPTRVEAFLKAYLSMLLQIVKRDA